MSFAHPASPEGLPASKDDGWHPKRILLIVVLSFAVALYFVLRDSMTSRYEKTILHNLEDYGVKYELDVRSRVARLILHGKQVDDDALDDVAKFPELRKLSLNNSSITDAGIMKIQSLTQLQNIGLTNTGVTDRGLLHLQAMTSLRNVYISANGPITDQGIESLRRALPAASVHVLGVRKQR